MPPQAAMEDYYAILEVERSALHEDIVSSYHRLALGLHPDRNHAPNATAAFQQLRQAYDVLSNATQRRAYDISFASTPQTNVAPARTNASPSAATQEPFLTDEEVIAKLQGDIQQLQKEVERIGDDLFVETEVDALIEIFQADRKEAPEPRTPSAEWRSRNAELNFKKQLLETRKAELQVRQAHFAEASRTDRH